MPIPTPGKGEEKDKFVSRCISAVKKADPNRPTNQVVAMCYTAWREDKKVKQEQDPDEVKCEWIEDTSGQYVKKVKQVTLQVFLETKTEPIVLVDGLIELSEDNGVIDVKVNYNRRLPERDIYLERVLTDIFVELAMKGNFRYEQATGVAKDVKLYDLVLLPSGSSFKQQTVVKQDDKTSVTNVTATNKLDKLIDGSEELLDTALKVKKLKLLDKMLEE